MLQGSGLEDPHTPTAPIACANVRVPGNATYCNYSVHPENPALIQIRKRPEFCVLLPVFVVAQAKLVSLLASESSWQDAHNAIFCGR